MNITTNDILDSLMRVALQPELLTTPNGSFSSPSIMSPIVSAITSQIQNDPELKASIVAQVVKLIPDMVPMLQQRLLNYVVEEHKSTSYNSSFTRAVIAKWAEEPIQAALAEALRSKIEERLPEMEQPLENYDVNITVNLVPK